MKLLEREQQDKHANVREVQRQQYLKFFYTKPVGMHPHKKVSA